MKIYCGDYTQLRQSRRLAWRKYILVLLCLGLTTAATPAMISYYWNGQYGTRNLALDEAMTLLGNADRPLSMRKSAELTLYFKAKRLVEALKEASDPTGVLNESALLLLHKLKLQIEED